MDKQEEVPRSGATDHKEVAESSPPLGAELDDLEIEERNLKIPTADQVHQRNATIYLEALERYPND